MWTRPESIECQTATELLDTLDPSRSLWAPFEYGRWAFRGQADAAWDLLPRALRPGERLSFRDKSLQAPLERRKQIDAEWRLLAEFIELADELGFHLPGDLRVFRFPWIHHEASVILNQSWPPASVLEIAAIAQHHGVPTRLLDLTFDPFVAAYFAALHADDSAAHLAVWAVDVEFIQSAWAPFDSGIRVVRVSRGSNPFLHAQSGLFVYDAANQGSLRERILDHDVEKQTHIGPDARKHLVRSARVRCVTLPTSQRAHLFTLLAARRITRAHLQPTLDNVVGELWSTISPPQIDSGDG